MASREFAFTHILNLGLLFVLAAAGIFVSVDVAYTTLAVGGLHDEIVEAQRAQIYVDAIGRTEARFRAGTLKLLSDSSAPPDLRELVLLDELDAQVQEDLQYLRALAVPALGGDLDALERALSLLRSLRGALRSHAELTGPMPFAAVLAEMHTISGDMHEAVEAIERSQATRLVGLLKRGDRGVNAARAVQSLGGVGLFVGIFGVWLYVRRKFISQAQELARVVEQLERRNDDLDAFTGRVAHDLRNLLVPIKLTTALIGGHPEQAATLTPRLARVIARADRLIGSLLTFSRSPGDQIRGVAYVQRAVEDVVEENRDLIDERQFEVSVNVDRHLVAGIRGDFLYQILANVVGNSVKYTSDCEVRRIAIRGHERAGKCVISVSDSGPGIPKEHQAHVFDAFYRAPGSHGTGLGIGLATVKRLVDAAGGEISIDSDVGRGTTFHVVLPLPPDAAAATPAAGLPNGGKVWETAVGE